MRSRSLDTAGKLEMGLYDTNQPTIAIHKWSDCAKRDCTDCKVK